MSAEITWATPKPLFGRSKHAFVEGTALCGRFHQMRVDQLDTEATGIACMFCQQAAKKREAETSLSEQSPRITERGSQKPMSE